MKANSEMPIAQFGQQHFTMDELTNSYFVMKSETEVSNNTTYPVVLHHPSGERIETQVRAHVLPNQMVKYRFNDLSIREGDIVKSWTKQIANPKRAEVLNSLTYDQIAKGETGQEIKKEPEAPKARKMPFIVLCIMGIVIAVFLYTIGVIIQTKDYVPLENGSLIGNYHPIQAGATGTITGMPLVEGEDIKKGDVLFSIGNAALDMELALAHANLEAAKKRVAATEHLINSEEKKFSLVVNQLKGNIEITRIELDKVQQLLIDQKENIASIMPLVNKRIISRKELKEETDKLKELQGEVNVKEAALAKDIATLAEIEKGKLTLLGDNVDNSLDRYEAELLYTKAALLEASAQVDAIKSRSKGQQVPSPSDGKIFAVYRNPGEYVEATESVLALNTDSESWAFGTIRRNLALKVKPGHPVLVEMPAFGIEVEGKVASIGHRGLYTEAGWSHDFRVDNNLSIPVKVSLPPIPQDLPTGIRLKMVIPLPLSWPWSKDVYLETIDTLPETDDLNSL